MLVIVGALQFPSVKRVATAILEGAHAPQFAPPREATVKKSYYGVVESVVNLDLFAKNDENGGSGQISLISATTIKPALANV